MAWAKKNKKKQPNVVSKLPLASQSENILNSKLDGAHGFWEGKGDASFAYSKHETFYWG